MTRLETVKSHTYVCPIITVDVEIHLEIARRRKLAWSATGRICNIFESNKPLRFKRMAFDQCVLSLLIYASKTWTLKASLIQNFKPFTEVLRNT